MAEERVLWTKTDSATFEVDYGANRKSAYKSFSPEDIARAYQLASGDEDPSAHIENPLQICYDPRTGQPAGERVWKRL